MEHFYTIQGEGRFSGSAAYFIRLAGCNVGCHWCDVKESWPAEGFPLVSVDVLTGFVRDTPAKIVVVTGGEPAMYPLQKLTDTLHATGVQCNIETSGAYPLRGDFDWVCVSPKKFKPPLETVLKTANELKVVIFNKSDFKWAEEHAAKVNGNCHLYLQPEWEKREQMMPLITEYVKQHPKWQVSLQTHKYLNIP